MRIFILAAAALAAAMLPASAIDGERELAAQETAYQAAGSDAGLQAFLNGLRPRAMAQGVSRATLDAVLPTLTFNQRVVDLDRDQPGGSLNNPAAAIPKFAPYFAKHVDADRISRGRVKYQALRPLLGRIEAQTGVPESIMVAIWGNETNYGAYTGDFDLLRSLATLAYDGRRRELFTEEFIATLKLLDRGIPRDRLKGSWAGATGYPQFLPSMYIRLGMDGDGDGKADIWGSQADALASIANYFVNAGWKPNLPWGTAASVPAGFDRDAVKPLITSPRCPRVHARHSRWLTIAEWRSRGVIPTGMARIPDNEQASLLEPDGPGATAYLLTTNYRSILDYNCSNFYAMSVGLLANAVAR
jgi:lytic murein transglycosylase